MTMHDHSLIESYVLDHFSTDRHNKVVQTTLTKIFWDFEGLGIFIYIYIQSIRSISFPRTCPFLKLLMAQWMVTYC